LLKALEFLQKSPTQGTSGKQAFRPELDNLIARSGFTGLTKRQITARLLSVTPHARALLLEKLGNRGMQPRVAEIMP